MHVRVLIYACVDDGLMNASFDLQVRRSTKDDVDGIAAERDQLKQRVAALDAEVDR